VKDMVHVQKGVLIECDPQMKQFLLHLDESNALGLRFIIQDLDSTHLFISSDIIDTLKNKIDDLMDQISFVDVN
jgi:TFIIH basal transcription factor complex TTD-A subunit